MCERNEDEDGGVCVGDVDVDVDVRQPYQALLAPRSHLLPLPRASTAPKKKIEELKTANQECSHLKPVLNYLLPAKKI